MQTDRRDIGGMVAAAILIAIGAVALYDTTTYSDIDSAVFPRTVAIALMLSAIGYIVYALVRGERTVRAPGGSYPRRIALVAGMLGAVVAMPWIGFVASGLVAFFCLTLVAMHDPWTPGRMILYPLVGVAIVLGFFALFRYGFLVPLPEGRLF